MESDQNIYRVRVIRHSPSSEQHYALPKSIITGNFLSRLYNFTPDWTEFEVLTEGGIKLFSVSNTAYLKKTQRFTDFAWKLKCNRQKEAPRELRNRQVHVFYSQSEYQQLLKNLSKTDMGSISEYVREVSLKASGKFLSPEEAADLKKTIRLLANIANNVNQIAVKLNAFKEGDVYLKLGREIDQGIKVIAEAKQALTKIRLS